VRLGPCGPLHGFGLQFETGTSRQLVEVRPQGAPLFILASQPTALEH
jgi:hypothetical protein